MSDLITVALIAVVPPMMVALLSLRSGIKSGRKLDEIHVMVNSRMDELLAVTRQLARMENKIQK